MAARATWNELCMDTTGGEALGRFWAAVVGAEFQPDEQAGNVMADRPGSGIAMCRVPEEKTVKHRVHLDVYTGSVDYLVELGGTVVLPKEESGYPWTVMTDPKGGEFCAFLRDEVPDYRLFQVVVDAADAEEIARWWGHVFGVEAWTGDTPGWWRVSDVPGMPFERMTFQQVPEPKTVKNRIHWDVYADVADMQAAGATLLRERDEEIAWDVMADPEGNEFCVFTPVVR